MSTLTKLLLALPLFSSHVRAATPDLLPVDSTRVRLAQAVVTGTRTPKSLATTPVLTRLISADDIRKADADDIRALLQHELPGLEFTQALSQQTHLNFAGFSGQGVLFLVDGERLSGETMDNVDFARINMADVERIEIVKGAASALYGSSAAGGVVNIITRRRAGAAHRASVEGRIGTHKEHRLVVTHGVDRQKVSQLFHLQHTTADGFALHNPKDVAMYTKYALARVHASRTWNAKEQLVFRPTADLSLTARATYFFRERDYDPSERNRYRDFAGGLQGDWRIAPHHRLEVSYAFDQYDKSDFHPSTDRDLRDYSNVTHNLRTLYTHHFTRAPHNNIIIGADYRRDYLMSYQFGGNRHIRHSADVFTQFDWTLSPAWELVTALRYDTYDQGHHRRLTPKVSVRYRTGGFTFRGSYGSGFRVPTLKEQFMLFHINDIFVIRGHSDLRPETSHNIQLSSEWRGEGCSLTAAGTFSRVADRITTSAPSSDRDPASGLPFVDYINVPHLEVYGLELSAALRRTCAGGTLSARLNYAFTHEEVGGVGTLTPYLPSRPHSATFRLDYDRRFSARYAAGLLLSGRILSALSGEEYNTLTAASRTIRYPAYLIARAALNQRIGSHLTLTLTADNLLDYRPHIYYYNAPLTDGRTFALGVKVEL